MVDIIIVSNSYECNLLPRLYYVYFLCYIRTAPFNSSLPVRNVLVELENAMGLGEYKIRP